MHFLAWKVAFLPEPSAKLTPLYIRHLTTVAMFSCPDLWPMHSWSNPLTENLHITIQHSKHFRRVSEHANLRAAKKRKTLPFHWKPHHGNAWYAGYHRTELGVELETTVSNPTSGRRSKREPRASGLFGKCPSASGSHTTFHCYLQTHKVVQGDTMDHPKRFTAAQTIRFVGLRGRRWEI